MGKLCIFHDGKCSPVIMTGTVPESGRSQLLKSQANERLTMRASGVMCRLLALAVAGTSVFPSFWCPLSAELCAPLRPGHATHDGVVSLTVSHCQ